MLLWVDDEKNPPAGVDCLLARKYDGACWFIHMFRDRISRIALDHDLGDWQNRTGYDFLCMIEEMLHTGELKKMPEIELITNNPSGRQKMALTIERIKEKFGNDVKPNAT